MHGVGCHLLLLDLLLDGLLTDLVVMWRFPTVALLTTPPALALHLDLVNLAGGRPDLACQFPWLLTKYEL